MRPVFLTTSDYQRATGDLWEHDQLGKLDQIAAQLPTAEPAPAPQPEPQPNDLDKLATDFEQKHLAQVDAMFNSPAAAADAPANAAPTSGQPGPAAAAGATPTSPLPTSFAPGSLQDTAHQAAVQAGIDPDIFGRQIQQESGFDPNAVSPAGARGVAQIVPSAHPGVNPDDPVASLKYAATWMRSLIDKYGGDPAKALAAYNAGPGAVDKYGGVPPFAETQRYVSNILGGGPSATGAQNAPAINGGVPAGGASSGGAQTAGLVPNQFGDSQLSSEEAYAACGPAAAVAFARANGRNPTLREAVDLAKQVGWTAAAGMGGIANEKALLDKMGIASTVDTNPSWDRIAADASTGNPVAISTPNHYFVADGFDAKTGKYHVGQSGTAFKAGAEWMTPEQITQLGGGINGALFADNPSSPTPSVAHTDQQAQAPVNSALDQLGLKGGQAASTVTGPVGDFADRLGTGLSQGLSQIGDVISRSVRESLGLSNDGPGLQSATGEPYTGGPPRPDQSAAIGGAVGNAATDFAQNGPAGATNTALKSAGDAIANSGANQFRSENFPNVTEPGHPSNVLAELQAKYGDSNPGGTLDPSKMTPEDQERYRNLRLAVGGVEMPTTPGPQELQAATKAVPELPAPRPVPGVQPIENTATQEIDRLRLDKFPEDVRPTIQQAAETTDFAQVQRRGVIPDAVAEQMARSYADDHTLEQLIRNGRAGQTYNTEELRAIRNATAGQAVKVNDLAAAIGGGDDSSQALADFFQEGLRLQRLVTVAEGARAEAGRSLRAFGGDVSAVPLNAADAVTRITKAVGGDRDKLLQFVTQYQQLVDQGSGPVQMANFWAKVTKPPVTAFDWFKALRYNSMISGVPTIGRIATTGALENAYGLVREGILHPSSADDAAAGAIAGFARGGQTFLETLSNGITEAQAAQGGLPRGIAPRLDNPLAKGAATALEFPGRIHQAIQDVAQQTAYYMRLHSLAAQHAVGDAAQAADLVANPTNAMMQDALAFSQRAAQRGELGATGAWMNRMPEPMKNLILPFLRVAYNIQARGIDRSPIGLLGTVFDVARTGGQYAGANTQVAVEAAGLSKAVRPFNERLFDNVVGTLVTGGAYQLATQGLITAGGPIDPRERDELTSQGWMPFSLKLGDHYVPYAALGPWATPLGVAAGIAEAGRYKSAAKPDGAAVLDAVRRSTELLTNESYLRDIADAYKMIQEPERYAPQVGADYAGSVIPYGALLNNAASAQDPTARSATVRGDPLSTIGGAVAERLPGLRETVPPRVGPLGQPEPNPRAGLAGFSPAAVSSVQPDPVIQAYQQAGIALPQAPQTVTYKNVQIQLSPDERAQFQQIAGERITDRAGPAISADGWDSRSVQSQTNRLLTIEEEARAYAEKRFLHDLGSDGRKQRLAEGTPTTLRRPLAGPGETTAQIRDRVQAQNPDLALP